MSKRFGRNQERRMREHRVKFPFKSVSYWHSDDDTGTHFAPGTRMEVCRDTDDTIYVADSIGFMVLTEVQRIEPPGFAPRVLYVREWIGPDGQRFGRKTLRMMSATAFDKLAKGYRHPYWLDGEKVVP